MYIIRASGFPQLFRGTTYTVSSSGSIRIYLPRAWIYSGIWHVEGIARCAVFSYLEKLSFTLPDGWPSSPRAALDNRLSPPLFLPPPPATINGSPKKNFVGIYLGFRSLKIDILIKTLLSRTKRVYRQLWVFYKVCCKGNRSGILTSNLTEFQRWPSNSKVGHRDDTRRVHINLKRNFYNQIWWS